MEVITKYNIGELVSYTSYSGKVMSNKVESISISIGLGFQAREVNWSFAVPKGIEINILYKLENTPAGYILNESSLFKKEEVVD